MSIECVRAVLESGNKLKGNDRLLMLALAEHADKDGIAYPGNECLRDETAMSERQVQRIIAKLADSGEIQILQQGNGRGIKRIMRVTVGTKKGDINTSSFNDEKGDIMLSPFGEDGDEKRVTNPHKKGDIFDKKGDIAVSPEPYNQKQPTTEPTTLPLSAALAEKSKTKKAKAKDPPEVLERRRVLKEAWLSVSQAENYSVVQVNAGIAQLERARVSPEELTACHAWMKLEPYWSIKTIYPQSVFKKIDEYRRWLERKDNTNGSYNGNGKPAPQFGILTRGAQDRERVAPKLTAEEIERGRAELRAHRAAVNARAAAGEPDLILERIKQQIALERNQGRSIPPA